jgi:hypothetical protein
MHLANHFIQRGAQDTIADDDFGNSLEFLTDERLPHMYTPEGSVIVLVQNIQLVATGSVVDILAESLNGVLSSYEMWSPARKEQQAQGIADWAGKFMNLLSLCDSCQLLLVKELFPDELLCHQFGDEFANDASDELVAIRERLGSNDSIIRFDPNETQYEGHLQLIKAALANTLQ